MQIADDFIGQRLRRIEKVEELKKLGIDPYPAHSVKEYPNNEITSNFEKYENKNVVLSGRLVSWRDHGKMMFANLQDQSGKIQLWLKTDDLSGDIEKGFLPWENLNLVDVGDFIEAHGTVTKTVRGEITLLVKHVRMLSKSIRLLPQKLAHKEQMFRRRYLDLTINPEHKELFLRKSRFWEVQREFMEKEGFIEVEVPVLEHVTGGADARPFITLHNELNQEFYMRISTELYQKRLIGGGFEKIFTVGPNFRNEGLSDEHLQEYSQIEWYWAYADYRDNMELTKRMFRHIAQEVYGKTKFSTRGHEFDVADEWQEIDYAATIKEHHGIDIFEDSDEKMKAALEKAGVDLPGAINRNRLIDNLWKTIRKTLAGPAFLVNEPKFMSPLAKSKPEDERLTERFHIVLGGSELGNGYSEINDPQDQLDRFLDQQKMRNQGDDEAQMLDIDYVEMLEYGMPPTSGYAHSERLFWFLEDITAREGTLFPQLRHEVESLTKDIYEETLKPYNIKLEKDAVQIGQFGKSKETKVAHAVILKDDSKPMWTRFNTVAHLTAALGSRKGMELTYIPESVTKDGEHIPMNIQHAIIVKETDTAATLLELKRNAEEKGLFVSVFTEEMMSTTNDNKVKQLQEEKNASEIGYLGVLVFGPRDTVAELTKSYQLLS
jgi:lysyl-tRNA synthetase class 2